MDIESIEYPQVRRILFVCLGNICRSPTAEAVFRAKAKEMGLSLEIDSAGTSAFHQGEKPDRRSRDAGRERGLNFSGIRSRQVVADDFHHFDLILAADNNNVAELMKLAKPEQQHKIGLILQWSRQQYVELPDPYYGDGNGFELVLDLLEQSAEKLLNRLSSVQL